jgi:hypothetical protein
MSAEPCSTFEIFDEIVLSRCESQNYFIKVLIYSKQAIPTLVKIFHSTMRTESTGDFVIAGE